MLHVYLIVRHIFKIASCATRDSIISYYVIHTSYVQVYYSVYKLRIMLRLVRKLPFPYVLYRSAMKTTKNQFATTPHSMIT